MSTNADVSGPDIWSLSADGTAKGRVRFGIRADLGIAVVAEGSGGHSGGGLGAEIVTDLLPVFLARDLGTEPPWLGLPAATEAHVTNAVAAISECLRRAWEVDRFYSNLVASFAAVILRQGTILLAHVGDCCIYRLRNGRHERLTEPHIDLHTGLLTKALGTRGSEHDLSIRSEPVGDGDQFILCSSAVAPAIAVMGSPSFEAAAEQVRSAPGSHAGCVVAEAHRRRSSNPLRSSAD